jgi:AraC-like DNA-binding protein
MQQIPDWYFAIVFFSSFLGFVVSAILFFINKNATFSSRLLSGFLICMSILALNYGLMVSSFYLRLPFLWRAFAWASISFGPLCYLYIRSVLEQSFRFKRWDGLLFLPAILLTLNHIPYFILPTSDKIEFLLKVIKDQKYVTLEPEGFLPPGWGAWARVLVGVVSTVGQFALLDRWKKRILVKENPSKQNVSTYRWLLLLSVIMALFFAIIILEFVFHFNGNSNLNYPIIFTISGTIFFVCISLLTRPSILYGMTGWLQEEKEAKTEMVNPVQDTVVETPKRNSLSIEQGRAYKETLENHFQTNLPFRKNGYAISDLSRELNIPSYQLSGFINQEYGKNFNELVNEYRIDYLVGLLKKSPDYLQFTFEALGKEAGFNSRAAFISAVKKKTGKTPSELFGRKKEGSPG